MRRPFGDRDLPPMLRHRPLGIMGIVHRHLEDLVVETVVFDWMRANDPGFIGGSWLRVDDTVRADQRV